MSLDGAATTVTQQQQQQRSSEQHARGKVVATSGGERHSSPDSKLSEHIRGQDNSMIETISETATTRQQLSKQECNVGTATTATQLGGIQGQTQSVCPTTSSLHHIHSNGSGLGTRIGEENKGDKNNNNNNNNDATQLLRVEFSTNERQQTSQASDKPPHNWPVAVTQNGYAKLAPTSDESETQVRNTNESGTSMMTSNDDQSTAAARYRPQKFCAVCGDKAIACNFNAVTCESCKAFFRRNAFKEQRLKCLFDSRCVIDKVTRRFCSKCRLLKCLNIGMKREWILTDEQKQVKRVKILQNKQTKRQQQMPTSSHDSGETTPRPRSRNSAAISDQMDNSDDHGSSSRLVVHEDEESETLASKKSAKRRRSSSSSVASASSSSVSPNSALVKGAQDEGASSSWTTNRRRRVEMRDASTSCPDDSNDPLPHYCSLAHQCQFCSARLQPARPLAATSQRLDSSYYFNHHVVYQQQQAQNHSATQQQQQAQVHYGQQPSANLYTPASNLQAYDASVCPTTSQLNRPQSPTSAINGTVAHQNDCYCRFGDMRHTTTQRLVTPSGAHLEAPPVINHFASHQQNAHSAATLPQPPPASIQYGAPSVRPAYLYAATMDTTQQQQQSPLGTVQAKRLDDLKRANEEELLRSAAASNPFVKALDAQRTALEKSPAESSASPINQQTSSNQQLSSSSETQHQQQGSSSNEPVSAPADCQVAVRVAAKNETHPDGSPLDKSKYIVWHGVVYAQPAIAESEMRARVETIDFTETERQLVYEMIDAIRFMFEPTSCDRTFSDESLHDFVYFCDAALRRLIKTVKQVSAFRILGMDDQIMLLKTACFKILLLRSCLHYNDDIEGWRDRFGRIMPLSLLKKAKSLVYDKHKEILTKITGPLRKDRIIMGFMSLVLLFDPQDKLRHTKSVGLDNLVYLCILRKYLIGTQPDPLEKYERLVEATQVINACNEEYNVFFSCNFEPEQITPLLIEIFDISINNSV